MPSAEGPCPCSSRALSAFTCGFHMEATGGSLLGWEAAHAAGLLPLPPPHGWVCSRGGVGEGPWLCLPATPSCVSSLHVLRLGVAWGVLGSSPLSPCVHLLPVRWVKAGSLSSILVTVTLHISVTFPAGPRGSQPLPGPQPQSGGAAGFPPSPATTAAAAPDVTAAERESCAFCCESHWPLAARLHVHGRPAP